MTIRSLTEVGVRLEEAVTALPWRADDPSELYDQYEMVAIQILDSEHHLFREGELANYLAAILKVKELELRARV